MIELYLIYRPSSTVIFQERSIIEINEDLCPINDRLHCSSRPAVISFDEVDIIEQWWFNGSYIIPYDDINQMMKSWRSWTKEDEALFQITVMSYL